MGFTHLYKIQDLTLKIPSMAHKKYKLWLCLAFLHYSVLGCSLSECNLCTFKVDSINAFISFFSFLTLVRVPLLWLRSEDPWKIPKFSDGAKLGMKML